MLDLFLHLDEHLREFTQQYGSWTYGILFAIVFCETGLVVTPILPGDSLLFAAGYVASLGSLDIWILGALLIVAAIAGDTVNYHLGYFLGPRVLRGDARRWLNASHLERTHRFFERYGAVTIILARFVPIVRTFAPFVAGIGAMAYRKFLVYNVIGGILWVVLFLGAGYWFGNIPLVKDNFPLVVMAIVFISVMPMVIEFVRARAAKRKASLESANVSSHVQE